METRVPSPSLSTAFLDGAIYTDYRPVIREIRVQQSTTCECSATCQPKPKPKPKPRPKPKSKTKKRAKARHLSGWSAPPPAAQAVELRA